MFGTPFPADHMPDIGIPLRGTPLTSPSNIFSIENKVNDKIL